MKAKNDTQARQVFFPEPAGDRDRPGLPETFQSRLQIAANGPNRNDQGQEGRKGLIRHGFQNTVEANIDRVTIHLYYSR